MIYLLMDTLLQWYSIYVYLPVRGFKIYSVDTPVHVEIIYITYYIWLLDIKCIKNINLAIFLNTHLNIYNTHLLNI